MDQAVLFLNINQYRLNRNNAVNYYNAASGFLHYMHGVNPNSKTYLTNMSRYGAENSVKSIYHGWFSDGSPLWDEAGVSKYGPAPGFVPGGPNRYYTTETCCATKSCGIETTLCAMNLLPPKNQPPQKAWKDFNTGWPINSWLVTENQIAYQAPYVRVLSKFVQ
jgi:hypothetical protein